MPAPTGQTGLGALHTALSVEIYARNLTGEGVAAARAELDSLGGAVPEEVMRKQVFAQEEQRVRLTEQYYREHPTVINPMTGATYSGTLPPDAAAKRTRMAEAGAKEAVNAENAALTAATAGSLGTQGGVDRAQVARFRDYTRTELRGVLTQEMREVQADLKRTVAQMERGAGGARVGGSMAGIPSAMQDDIRKQIARVQTDLQASIMAMAKAPLAQLEALSADLEGERKRIAMGGKATLGGVTGAVDAAAVQVDTARTLYQAQIAKLQTAAQDQVTSILTTARTEAAATTAEIRANQVRGAAEMRADWLRGQAEMEAARAREVAVWKRSKEIGDRRAKQNALDDRTRADVAAAEMQAEYLRGKAEQEAQRKADLAQARADRSAAAKLEKEARAEERAFEANLNAQARDMVRLQKALYADEAKADKAAAAAADKAAKEAAAHGGGAGIGGSFTSGIGGGGYPSAGSLGARAAYLGGSGVAGLGVASALTQIYGAYQGVGLEAALTAAIAQGAGPEAMNMKVGGGTLYGNFRSQMPQMMSQYGITDWNSGLGALYFVLSRGGFNPATSKKPGTTYNADMQIMTNAAKMQAFTGIPMDQGTQYLMNLLTDTRAGEMAPGKAQNAMIDRMTNALVQAHRFSAVPMEDLLSGSGRSMSQLLTMGFTPEDLLSGAATMTQHGMSGSQAWTALTMFATRLAKPTSKLGTGPEFASVMGIENVRKNGLPLTLEKIVAISRQLYADQTAGKVFYDAAGKALPTYHSPADVEMALFGDIRGSQRSFSQLVGFGDTGLTNRVSGMMGDQYDASAPDALQRAYGNNISAFFSQFSGINQGLKQGVSSGQNILGQYADVTTPTAMFGFHKMVADFKELADVMNGPLAGNMAAIFNKIDGLLMNISAFEKTHKTTGGIISDLLLGAGAVRGVGILERVLIGTSNEKELTAGITRYIGLALKGVPAATKALWLGQGAEAAAAMGTGIAGKAGVASLEAGVASAAGAVGADLAAGAGGAAAGTATAGAAASALGVSLAGAISVGLALALPVAVGVALGHVLEWASSQVGDWESAHQKQALHELQQKTAKHAADVSTLHIAQSGGAHAYLNARQTDLTRIFGGRGPLAARYSWNHMNMLGDQSLAMAHAMSTWGMSHPAQAHDLGSVSRQMTAQLGANPRALQDALVGFYEHMHGKAAPMRGTKAFTDLVNSPDFEKWFGTAQTNKKLIGNIALDLAREFAAYWPHSPAEKGPLSQVPDLVKWLKGPSWADTLSQVAGLGHDMGTALVAGDPTGGLAGLLPPGGVPTGSPRGHAAARVLQGRGGQGGGYWQYASFGETIVDPMLVRRVRSGLRYLPTPTITGSEQDFAYDLFSAGMAGAPGGGPQSALVRSGALTGRASALGSQVSGGTALAHLKAIADATTAMARASGAKPRPVQVHVRGGSGAPFMSDAHRLRGLGIALSK